MLHPLSSTCLSSYHPTNSALILINHAPLHNLILHLPVIYFLSSAHLSLPWSSTHFTFTHFTFTYLCLHTCLYHPYPLPTSTYPYPPPICAYCYPPPMCAYHYPPPISTYPHPLPLLHTRIICAYSHPLHTLILHPCLHTIHFFTRYLSPHTLILHPLLHTYRFEYIGTFGGKINKPISFQEYVNMRPYMSDTKVSNTTSV